MNSTQTVQQALKEWRKLVAPHMSRCLCQSGASADLGEGFFEFGELPNNPCFKCNLKCWAQGIGIITTTGNVNTTVMGSIFGITDEIVHKCGSNTHVDICQKTYEILSCTYNMVAARAAGNSRNRLSVTSLPAGPQPKIWEVLPQLLYIKQ